jgi:hypothetical protein
MTYCKAPQNLCTLAVMQPVTVAVNALLSIIIDGLRLNHDRAMGGIRPVPEPFLKD